MPQTYQILYLTEAIPKGSRTHGHLTVEPECLNLSFNSAISSVIPKARYLTSSVQLARQAWDVQNLCILKKELSHDWLL